MTLRHQGGGVRVASPKETDRELLNQDFGFGLSAPREAGSLE
jgi:hypothetical protein